MKIKTSDFKTNEIIKIMREYVDKTQFELAEECKINRRSVQDYEYGTVNYTFETLVKIANYYNFEIKILNVKYPVINATNYKTNEVIKMIRKYIDRTQFELADEVHISRSALQTYEYGTVNYTFETLVKIAKHYHFEITIESTSKTDKMINHKY